MLSKSEFAAERWINPYDYKRRSRSFENNHSEVLRPNTHISSLRSKNESCVGPSEISASAIINRGLSLAGYALDDKKHTGPLRKMKDKNFSTSDISRSPHIEVHFDLKNPPDDITVDSIFDDLLKDRTFFWGDARKNLQSISKKRKWALVCKMHSNDAFNSEYASNDSLPSALKDADLLQQLDSLLMNSSKISKTLYQLEKLLRQSCFCEMFISRDHIKTLSNCASLVKPSDQFVYLRCFKTIMNYEDGRLSILNRSPLVYYLCSLLSDNVTHLRIKLLSAELLLLLTYVDDQFGYERVLIHLDGRLCSWVKVIEGILSAPASNQRPTDGAPSFLQYVSAEQLAIDFVTTSLFLINSIVQVLPNIQRKLILIKRLKEFGIHRCFRLVKQLNSSVVAEQIHMYTNLEQNISADPTYSTGYTDFSYGTSLTALIAQAKGTAVEKHLERLFQSLNDTMVSRTTSESIKIYKALGSMLNYFVDNLYTEVSIEPESLFQTSINRFMDNMQTDENARRAMSEITELENTIALLKEEVRQLKEFKDSDKEEVTEQLKQARESGEIKDSEIHRLKARLEQSEVIRRDVKKKFDQTMAHKDSKDWKRPHESVFESLKYRHQVAAKPSSLFKSHRMQSLSSYVSDCSELNVHPNCLEHHVDKNNQEFVNSSNSRPVAFPITQISTEKTSKVKDYHLNHSQTSFFGSSHSEAILRSAKSSETINSAPPSSPTLTSLLPHSSSPQGLQPPPPPPPPPLPVTLIKSIEKKNIVIHNDQLESTSAPPPPPLPSSFLAPQKTPFGKPKEALRQIHWDKINDIEETLWEDKLQREETIKELQNGGIFSQIEDNFKVKERIIKRTEESGVPDKCRLKSFLSRDLAHQFGINLHMFSQYSAEEFVSKVLQCDNEIIQNVTALEFFNREDLIHIPTNLAKSFAPYSANYLTKEEPSKDPNELDRPDRIYLELCFNLKLYWHDRSLCLLILTTYERDYYDLIFRLQKIDDAIQRLKNTSRFKNLLFIIIEIGNYMNKKNVSGIRLSSLSKLAFVKSSIDNSMSFLHFIERLVRVKYPDIYGFTDDLNKVEDLGKISFGHIELECKEFCSNIENVSQIISEGKLSDIKQLHPNDRVVDKLRSKISRAKAKRNLLWDQFRLINNDFRKVMQYFGEDFNDMDSKSGFFQHFIEFSIIFKKCARENSEKEEIERIYEQRKSLLETRHKSNTNMETADEESVDKGDVVDNLLSKLRGVEKNPEPLRRRRSTKLLGKSDHEKSSGKDTCDLACGNGMLLERTQAMLNDIQNI